jgi:glyoxylase-like metal-dependent hydrolase (beta-lactamase superfamily II)
MKIHHINCGTMCGRGGALFYGDGPHMMPCHCLLIETEEGLVLVDTGFGLDDLRDRGARLGGGFRTLARPTLSEAECALRQIEALGYQASDVRHIVLTHLDLDHAGGLGDFPKSTVHVYGPEYRSAVETKHFRYLQAQFRHVENWSIYDDLGEPWFGFRCVRELAGLPPEILLVPLEGHTLGHAGIAVHQGSGWLLHCGDAYFHRHTVCGGTVPWGVRCFQTVNQVDRVARVQNQGRLKELCGEHGDEVEIFCSHDAVEFQRLSAPRNEDARTD